MKTADVISILIQSGFLGALLGLGISAIKRGKSYLDAKTAESTEKIKDVKEGRAINNAESSISTVVLEMAQTVVDDLKSKSADGKLTPDEIQQVQSDTINKIQTLITTDGYNTLDTAFGDVNAWIKSKIEAEVKKLKANTTPVLQSTAKTSQVLINEGTETGKSESAQLETDATAEETAQPANDVPAENTAAAPETEAMNIAPQCNEAAACAPTATQDTTAAPAQMAEAPNNITINVSVPYNVTPAEAAKQIAESFKQVAAQIAQ